MNLIAAVRARLKSRSDSEHEQAILRIVIFAVVVAYLAAIYLPSDGIAGRGHGEPLPLQGLMVALVFSILLFLAICIWPAPSPPRRVIGMLVDVGTATFCMALVGEAGVSMVGVYLCLIFGNGFHYGRRDLFACQALCLFGYGCVLLFAPYWQAHRITGWSLIWLLLVIPNYVATLLRRVLESRARTEQPLKECLAREHASG